MSANISLIRRVNMADSIVELARVGTLPTVCVIEQMVEIGFYDVQFAEPGFVGKIDGIKFRFPFTSKGSLQ